MKLYLATGNAKKLKELQAIISEAELPIQVENATALGGMPEVEEDAGTFSGNALKKAKALLARASGDTWVLADDSGLCVDALDGDPGVYSARYAGEGASDAANVDKLLRELTGVETKKRGAAFVCVLALVRKSEEPRFFEGSCEGRITDERFGEGGFGYDPVFVPQGRDRTFAELTSATKAELSHRGKALQKFIAWAKERG
ncbi:MAG: RdgB/HAM1 family non-canonical purine NTP pyrophosphatase [Symploca sp. SIO2D2]|nr:RdgB/HAM1 family non-canonical purine NTP pyrophosphatase [Symploca sp. SIO2D2]